MKHSESIDALAGALAAAQGAMELASKDSNNPFFNSKYADLAAYVGVSRGPLAANGLALVQDVEVKEGAVAVLITTMIIHSSGQWMEFTPILVPVGYINKMGEWIGTPDAQGVGSAITYGRRYGMGASLGLAAEDDDGNAAVGKGPPGGSKAAIVPMSKTLTPPPKPVPPVPPTAPAKSSTPQTVAQLNTLVELTKHPIGGPLLEKLLKGKKLTHVSTISGDDSQKTIDWVFQNIKAREEAAKQAAATPPVPPVEPPVQGDTPDERGE
jgi:ERF superfamily